MTSQLMEWEASIAASTLYRFQSQGAFVPIPAPPIFRNDLAATLESLAVNMLPTVRTVQSVQKTSQPIVLPLGRFKRTP